MWAPDICLVWAMLVCLSRRRAELLNRDMMLDSESITTGEFWEIAIMEMWQNMESIR